MKTIEHRGYIAELDLDEDAEVIHGRVTNARAVLTFSASDIKDLKKEFAATIEDYLEWCAQRGKDPERPYSGVVNLRMSPGLHARAAAAAAREGASLNTFICKAIECHVVYHRDRAEEEAVRLARSVPTPQFDWRPRDPSPAGAEWQSESMPQFLAVGVLQ